MEDMDPHGEDGGGSEMPRLSMTDKLMVRIRKYAPELEIFREVSEFDMMIGHHPSAEFGRPNQSSSNTDLVDKSELDLNDEVASESVDAKDRVTSTDCLDKKKATRDRLGKLKLSQDKKSQYGKIPPSPLMLDSKIRHVDFKDRIEGVRDPGVKPINSTLLVRSQHVYSISKRRPRRRSIKPREPRDSALDKNEATNPLKLTSSETKEKVVKSGQRTPSGWRNLWGLFRRAAKVHPMSILQDSTTAALDSLPKIGEPESDPVSTKQEENENDLVVSLVDDPDFARHKVEEIPESHCDDDKIEVIAEGVGGLSILKDGGQIDDLKILQSLTHLPGCLNPFEGSPQTSTCLTSDTSGHEHHELAKYEAMPTISQDSSELTPSEVKVTDIVETLGAETEMEKGHMVPIEILFPTKPQLWIKGEESDEEPGLFDDDSSSFPNGEYFPPIVSNSIVVNLSGGSIWDKRRRFFLDDFQDLRSETEKEPPKSKWKAFFRKKKNKVAKTAEKKSRDETPRRSKMTSWIGGLTRTVRERWNKLTGRKRSSVAPASPATIIPEETTKDEEVSKARGSTSSTKSEPILGKSSKSKIKRWKIQHEDGSLEYRSNLSLNVKILFN